MPLREPVPLRGVGGVLPWVLETDRSKKRSPSTREGAAVSAANSSTPKEDHDDSQVAAGGS